MGVRVGVRVGLGVTVRVGVRVGVRVTVLVRVRVSVRLGVSVMVGVPEPMVRLAVLLGAPLADVSLLVMTLVVVVHTPIWLLVTLNVMTHALPAGRSTWLTARVWLRLLKLTCPAHVLDTGVLLTSMS